MKFAIIIARSPDNRSGKAVTELAPFDETLTKFRKRIADGVAFHDKFTIMELWTTSGVKKTHKFKPDQTPSKVQAKKRADADKAKADADKVKADSAKAKVDADAKAKADEEAKAAGKATGDESTSTEDAEKAKAEAAKQGQGTSQVQPLPLP